MNETSKRNDSIDRDEPEGGWTFIETLIVMGIILILSSAVGFMAVRYLDKAKTVTAKSQIETFSLALDAYFLDTGEYPSAAQGLEALWKRPTGDSTGAAWKGPYLTKPVPVDPWGNAYEYGEPGPDGLRFGIRSFGRDGREGGEDEDADIVSWE